MRKERTKEGKGERKRGKGGVEEKRELEKEFQCKLEVLLDLFFDLVFKIGRLSQLWKSRSLMSLPPGPSPFIT